MKLVLVASLAAVLGMGMSGEAAAHGYAPRVGGSIYWAGDGVAIGFNYGAPLVAPYYVPPRYAYRPAAVRYAHWQGRHHGHYKGYKKGYKDGYRHGYRKGDRHGRSHDRHDRRR